MMFKPTPWRQLVDAITEDLERDIQEAQRAENAELFADGCGCAPIRRQDLAEVPPAERFVEPVKENGGFNRYWRCIFRGADGGPRD